MTSLDDALAQAKKDNRAVMAVFPSTADVRQPRPPPSPTRGIAVDEPQASTEEKSGRVVLTDSKEFRTAVKNANLVAAKVIRPTAPPPSGGGKITEEDLKAAGEYSKAAKAYETALKKYGLEEARLPAVVWLAPDGSQLAKLVQPDDEAIFVKTISEVPPKLANWITNQRRLQMPPDAAGGIRSDMPAPAGSRPAPPPEKE
jgi:hypothetical protein